MDKLNSKQDADLYFERLATELEAIAGTVRQHNQNDQELAERLRGFARRIRRDSGLPNTTPEIPPSRKAG